MVKCSSQGVPQLVQALMKNLRGPLHHAVYTRLFKVVWGSPATPERPNQSPWPVFKISLHFKRKPRDRAKEWSRFRADPASATLTFPFTFLSTLLTHPTSRLLLWWVYSVKWGKEKVIQGPCSQCHHQRQLPVASSQLACWQFVLRGPWALQPAPEDHCGTAL